MQVLDTPAIELELPSVNRPSSPSESQRNTVGAGANRDASHIDVEPLDATFRGGGKAPLHSWFHYPEGYSPAFVRRVREAYLPGAGRVLEPFAGSGTTPIVLGQDGIECDFSEANPAMELVARAKLNALAPHTDRQKLSNQLGALAQALKVRLKSIEPSTRLHGTYGPSFGKSVYFSEVAYRYVLQLRALGDELAQQDSQVVSDCLSVAVMSSLLPSSYLKRAGDVRFRTERELKAGLPSIVDEVGSKLARMAHDVTTVEPLKATCRFLTSDARGLSSFSSNNYQGVITSPPYLNGTNYIRNSRLELWYLGNVSHRRDFRQLRDQVVTSGINDVDANTNYTAVSRPVEQVMQAIALNCYDERIAKMVGGYFFDMRAVLDATFQCLDAGSRACVDIGDSIYGGIHVPTDDLLEGIAYEVGFAPVDRLYLRKRRSKDGTELRQTLLVFQKPGRNRSLAKRNR